MNVPSIGGVEPSPQLAILELEIARERVRSLDGFKPSLCQIRQGSPLDLGLSPSHLGDLQLVVYLTLENYCRRYTTAVDTPRQPDNWMRI